MTRARRGLVSATAVVLALLSTAGPATAGDVASAGGSIVSDWKIRTLGVKQTVTFAADGRVFGDAGCNRFTGTYTVKGETVKMGPLASTKRFCDGKMDGEDVFLNRLQNVVAYQATATRLRLFTPRDLMILKAA